MQYYTIFELLYPGAFLSLAAILVLFAAWIIASKRPLIYSGKISLGAFFLFFFPTWVYCTTIVFYGPRGANTTWDLNEVGMIGIPLLMLVLYRRFNGYVVVGISRDATTDSLKEVLKSHELEFEEIGKGTLLLKGEGTKFTVCQFPGMWFNTLRIARGERSLLNKVAKDIRAGFAEKEIKPSYQFVGMQSTAAFCLVVASFALYYHG